MEHKGELYVAPKLPSRGAKRVVHGYEDLATRPPRPAEQPKPKRKRRKKAKSTA